MTSIHPLSRLALLRPRRVADQLERIRCAGVVRPHEVPNLWQLTLGVLRMWHRLMFRADTVGTCTDFPVRATWRARMLQFRPLRFPFLLAERAVAPWDMTGLLSDSSRLTAHLVGAHHDKNQAVYDLQILLTQGVSLHAFRDRVAAIVDGSDPRAGWWRDLVVFDRYHESLLAIVERLVDGDPGLEPAEATDPDVSFVAYLRWCALQPSTPEATFAALSAGRYHVGVGLTDLTHEAPAC